MVKKIILIFLLVASFVAFSSEYVFEPCETSGAVSWPYFGSVSTTNLSSDGGNAVKCIFNNDGAWGGDAYSMYELARTLNMGTIGDLSKIKMDVYNPHSTNLEIRIFITTTQYPTKWQFSEARVCSNNQWTTLEFDLNESKWNSIDEWNWPDSGSWNQPVLGKDGIKYIYPFVFKNDGQNINLGQTYFILDNIRLVANDTLLSFEDYSDNTMQLGSTLSYPVGSSITDVISSSAYDGAKALQIDYSIASGTNAIVTLPQLSKNIENSDLITAMAKGVGQFKLMLTESSYAPSDGETWLSSSVSISNSDWEKVYFPVIDFSIYGTAMNNTFNKEFLNALSFQVFSGTNTLYLDDIKLDSPISDNILDIFPYPGDIQTNFSSFKVMLYFGFDYTNFHFTINGQILDKNSASITIDTNNKFIKVDIHSFQDDILKINFQGNYAGQSFQYNWSYYRTHPFSVSTLMIDDFESYSGNVGNGSSGGWWNGADSIGSSISLSESSSAFEGAQCVKVDYSIVQGDAWAYMSKDLTTVISASPYKYISFYGKGVGSIYIGLLEASDTGNSDKELWVSSHMMMGSQWQKYIFPIDSLTVTPNSKKGGIFDKSKIAGIEFDFDQPTDGTTSLYFDAIQFVSEILDFTLLTYVVSTSNELLLQFNNVLNETKETLLQKIIVPNSLQISNIDFKHDGGVKIHFKNALQNNTIYKIELDNIKDDNGKSFSDTLYVYSINVLYSSGDVVPVSGGGLGDVYGDILIIDSGTFNTPSIVEMNRISKNIASDNMKETGIVVKLDYKSPPEKDNTLLIPYYMLDENDYNSNNLTIVWFDGVHWIPVQTENNIYGKYVMATVNSSGEYAVVSMEKSDSSGRIFDRKTVHIFPDVLTPNSDGINDFVKFSYYLSKPSYVSIRIFTLTGILIKTIKDENVESEGYHSELIWNGETDVMNLKSGVYFYQLEAVASDNASISDKVVKTITIVK